MIPGEESRNSPPCSLLCSAAVRLMEACERLLECICLFACQCVCVCVCVWGGDIQLCMDGADKNTRAERAITPECVRVCASTT